MSGTLRLGNIAGVPLLMHWSLLVIAGFIAVNLGRVLSPAGGVTAWAVAAAVLAAVLFFGSVLAHELSHALTARRFDIGTESITLWALGGVARLDREPASARAQGWVAVAGPIMSLVLGVVFIGGAVLLHLFAAPAEIVTVTAWLGVINGLLAVFNMLPGSPLDGGRVLAAVRWGRHGDRYRAMEEAAIAGRVLGWTIAGVGVWMMMSGYGGIFIALSGAFIALNATAERVGAQVRQHLGSVTIGDLTRYGIAHAHGATTVEELLWQRLRLGPARVAAVMDDHGHITGLITEDQMWAVDADRRDVTTLHDIAVPMERLGRVRPDESLAEALGHVQSANPTLTVWVDDQLVGVVPADVLQDRLVQAQASRTMPSR
jgi:Zn-dependent protease